MKRTCRRFFFPGGERNKPSQLINVCLAFPPTLIFIRQCNLPHASCYLTTSSTWLIRCPARGVKKFTFPLQVDRLFPPPSGNRVGFGWICATQVFNFGPAIRTCKIHYVNTSVKRCILAIENLSGNFHFLKQLLSTIFIFWALFKHWFCSFF